MSNEEAQLEAETTVDPILDDWNLRIEAQDESKFDRVIVIFSGIGSALDGVPTIEFARSMRNSDVRRSVFYVVDKQRRWYNGAKAQVLEVLTPRLQGREVTTVGNSMGGFAAMMFAGLLPNCEGAIAFVPQFSVHPSQMPRETRWRDLIREIDVWTDLSCTWTPGIPVARTIFVGSEDRLDAAQAAKFSDLHDPNLSIVKVSGFGHNLALELSKKEILVPVLDRLVDEPANILSVLPLLRVAGLQYSVLRGDQDPTQFLNDSNRIRLLNRLPGWLRSLFGGLR